MTQLAVLNLQGNKLRSIPSALLTGPTSRLLKHLADKIETGLDGVASSINPVAATSFLDTNDGQQDGQQDGDEAREGEGSNRVARSRCHGPPRRTLNTKLKGSRVR